MQIPRCCGAIGVAASYTGRMPRLRLAAAAAAGVLALAGCADVGLTVEDAYRVGCPSLDAVAASGATAGKVALAGLEHLRDSGQVSGEAKQWVERSITFLADPDKVSDADKRMLRDGCAAHGYTLQNVG